MALTLAEAAKLSNDVLRAGVIDVAVKESPILQVLPFIDIQGNGLTYNRENVQPTSAFYDVGDTWTEGVPTFTQLTATLRIMGGDADVDNFLARTRSNIQDLEATVLERKAMSIVRLFEDTFFYGNENVNPKAFDGIQRLTATAQRFTTNASAVAAPLSLMALDEMIDAVRPGKPDMLLMSRRTRRNLSAYARASGSPVEYAINEFGQRVGFYDGIPIGVSDYLLDTELADAGGLWSASTGGAASTIYALKVGEGLVAGLQAEPPAVERIGELETKDATRHRVKWYASLAVFNTQAIAYITNISDAVAVA